jgi:hypothetical protein
MDHKEKKFSESPKPYAIPADGGNDALEIGESPTMRYNSGKQDTAATAFKSSAENPAHLSPLNGLSAGIYRPT